MSPQLRTGAALAAALALAAPAHAQQEAPAAETEAQPAADPATVVAIVNGEEITLGDLIGLRADLPQEYQSLPDQALYDGLRQQLIDQTLLSQAAEAEGLAERPEVARAIEIQRRSLLADAYMRSALAERLTPDALQQAYQERYVEAEPVEEVRASHILVESEERAKELRAELDAGADFAEVAREHGTDGTAEAGGDLGYFSDEMMVPEFSDAAFALDVGETSEPVQSPFGWHLILLTDRRERPTPPIDAVSAQLAQALSAEAAQEVMEGLREAASIDAPEDRPGVEALGGGSPAEQ